MRILFVCLGNICRSPLAEAIFNHKIRNLDGFESYSAGSCGTSDYHIGELPDLRTRKNAERNGVLIEHRGRQLHPQDLETFDLILAMDRSNYETIHRLPNAAMHQSKIALLRSYDPHPGDEVPDPYYGEERDFQNVFEIVERSIEGLLLKLKGKETGLS
jgi:protein-tyrosine phosphatase